jgi:hypothetical protein
LLSCTSAGSVVKSSVRAKRLFLILSATADPERPLQNSSIVVRS